MCAQLLQDPVLANPTVVLVADRVDLVRNAWDQFRSLWTDDESTDPRYGPRVWKWSGRQRSSSKLRPSDRWQQEVFRMRNAPPDSPAGMRVSLPTTESPMNYVSPAAAVYVAALAGGRLPTSAEWKAARTAGRSVFL